MSRIRDAITKSDPLYKWVDAINTLLENVEGVELLAYDKQNFEDWATRINTAIDWVQTDLGTPIPALAADKIEAGQDSYCVWRNKINSIVAQYSELYAHDYNCPPTSPEPGDAPITLLFDRTIDGLNALTHRGCDSINEGSVPVLRLSSPAVLSLMPRNTRQHADAPNVFTGLATTPHSMRVEIIADADEPHGTLLLTHPTAISFYGSGTTLPTNPAGYEDTALDDGYWERVATWPYISEVNGQPTTLYKTGAMRAVCNSFFTIRDLADKSTLSYPMSFQFGADEHDRIRGDDFHTRTTQFWYRNTAYPYLMNGATNVDITYARGISSKYTCLFYDVDRKLQGMAVNGCLMQGVHHPNRGVMYDKVAPARYPADAGTTSVLEFGPREFPGHCVDGAAAHELVKPLGGSYDLALLRVVGSAANISNFNISGVLNLPFTEGFGDKAYDVGPYHHDAHKVQLGVSTLPGGRTAGLRTAESESPDYCTALPSSGPCTVDAQDRTKQKVEAYNSTVREPVYDVWSADGPRFPAAGAFNTRFKSNPDASAFGSFGGPDYTTLAGGKTVRGVTVGGKRKSPVLAPVYWDATASAVLEATPVKMAGGFKLSFSIDASRAVGDGAVIALTATDPQDFRVFRLKIKRSVSAPVLLENGDEENTYILHPEEALFYLEPEVIADDQGAIAPKAGARIPLSQIATHHILIRADATGLISAVVDGVRILLYDDVPASYFDTPPTPGADGMNHLRIGSYTPTNTNGGTYATVGADTSDYPAEPDDEFPYGSGVSIFAVELETANSEGQAVAQRFGCNEGEGVTLSGELLGEAEGLMHDALTLTNHPDPNHAPYAAPDRAWVHCWPAGFSKQTPLGLVDQPKQMLLKPASKLRAIRNLAELPSWWWEPFNQPWWGGASIIYRRRTTYPHDQRKWLTEGGDLTYSDFLTKSAGQYAQLEQWVRSGGGCFVKAIASHYTKGTTPSYPWYGGNETPYTPDTLKTAEFAKWLGADDCTNREE